MPLIFLASSFVFMKANIIDLDVLNQKIPRGYLWDGFWIDSYKRKTLNISASFDKIYYRDIMIVYKGVTFFNLPYQWRDSNVAMPWMRYGNRVVFANLFPETDIENKYVIEWQIADTSIVPTTEVFYIVCDKVFVFKCEGAERDYDMTYEEPLSGNDYAQLRFQNRLPYLGKSIKP